MTFQVPQFIEQKPKIVGPLTLEQFAYIGGAAGISIFSFYVFNFFLWFLITSVLGGLAVMLAFVKINGQSLPRILRSALGFWIKPRTYTWQRRMAETSLEVPDLEKIMELRKNMSIQDRLKTAALNITTGKIFSVFQAPTEEREVYQPITFMTGEKKLVRKVDYK